MTTESILLAICFGYMLGDTLSKLVVVVSDVVRSIKRRKQTKTGKQGGRSYLAAYFEVNYG